MSPVWGVFCLSKADPDIWMKDCGDHYSHVAVYVDDCLYAGKDGKAFFDELKSLVLI